MQDEGNSLTDRAVRRFDAARDDVRWNGAFAARWGVLAVVILVAAAGSYLYKGPKTVTLENLNEEITGWSGHIIDYAAIAAAVGTISMALVELAKGLLMVRQWVQGAFFVRWVARFLPSRARETWSDRRARREEAANAFYELTCGHPSYRLVWLDQPSDRMFAQLQGAAHIILDCPLGPGRESAFEILTGTTPPEGALDEVRRRQLGYVAARRIEALQTRVDYWWARGNQFAAIAASFFLFWYFLSGWAGDVLGSGGVLAASFLGGLVAPVAKDLVNQLSKASSTRG